MIPHKTRNVAKGRWFYSFCPTMLYCDDEPFAVVTLDGGKALPPNKAKQLVDQLDRGDHEPVAKAYVLREPTGHLNGNFRGISEEDVLRRARDYIAETHGWYRTHGDAAVARAKRAGWSAELRPIP